MLGKSEFRKNFRKKKGGKEIHERRREEKIGRGDVENLAIWGEKRLTGLLSLSIVSTFNIFREGENVRTAYRLSTVRVGRMGSRKVRVFTERRNANRERVCTNVTTSLGKTWQRASKHSLDCSAS